MEPDEAQPNYFFYICESIYFTLKVFPREFWTRFIRLESLMCFKGSANTKERAFSWFTRVLSSINGMIQWQGNEQC